MRIRWENRHTERLRQARIGWDLTEVGAPCFGPDWETDPDDIHLLRIAAAYGDCPPGAYRYRCPPPDFECSFYVDELAADSVFRFTAEHRTLLTAMSWTLFDPYFDDDLPGADPKRPYGDFTFYQLEMALALGRIPAHKPADHDPMTPEIVEAMTALHFQTQPALQVFLQNFEIPAGRVFAGEEWGGWAPEGA